MDFQLSAPPPDLAPCIAACLEVGLDGPHPGYSPTHFPALVEGGLTVVLEGALGVLSPHGSRQFERVFGATFGMRPKLFQRVARFEGTLREALSSGRMDALLALDRGYFDQSHLGKDARALAGAPLGALAGAVRTRDTEHWPLVIGAAYRRAGMSHFS